MMMTLPHAKELNKMNAGTEEDMKPMNKLKNLAAVWKGRFESMSAEAQREKTREFASTFGLFLFHLITALRFCALLLKLPFQTI
jgi:hypothetical protein